MIKVVTVVGTRPELIRLSCVIKKLEKYTDHVLVHTGQNFDFELNQIFFDDLNISEPKYYLDIDTTSVGRVYGNTIIKCEEIFREEKPDAVLILGDTNSSIAAIIAKRMRIPIFHMEAGNRSFDLNVPEEINRKIIDHIADFNLVYTEHARRHLISEGFPQRRIYLTGSPLFEVIEKNKEKILSSNILANLNLEKKNYFLVSAHREENVDNTKYLLKIISLLNKIAEKYSIKIIVSTHPRTKKRLEKLPELQINHLISFMKPFSFTNYINLQMNALCVISDSGTISEESAILSFPAISLRESMERPEAQDHGTIVLSGFDEDIVLDSIKLSIEESILRKYNPPIEYIISDTSWRVIKLILGNARLSNKWWGIK